MRQLSVVLAVFTLAACKCGPDGNNDGGTDGGGDAGPPRCSSTADCVAAGVPDLVCDPQERICVAKCGADSDCTYVASGVCEPLDGTCRPPCGAVDTGDYCPEFDAGVICREQSGHCVKKCHQDRDCIAIAKGTNCTEATGQCSDDGVLLCNTMITDPDLQCRPANPDDHCFYDGTQCSCVNGVSQPDSGFDGTCLRRNLPCTECMSDLDCGANQPFAPTGACKTVAGDTSGKKFCLYQHNQPCGCGFFDNGDGYCAPAPGRTCANAGCVKDADCPGGSVCDTQNCACVPRCRWDFALKQTAAPGCPPNQVCWVDNENLDPTSVYYGSGRCKAPCSTDTDCTGGTNPHGGPKLKCAEEQLAGGGLSPKRCRANGACMDDLECPPQPDTSVYYGYCDRGAFTCNLDCRTGVDPVSQKTYNDCRSPYGCIADGGSNVCVLKTCVQQGGASIACNAGEYCCGEDKDNNGQADPCPPSADQSAEKCYKAPAPPFCTACMSNDDCKTLQLPSWLVGACANGSKSPSCSPYPIFCYTFQEQMTMREVNVCAPSTYNDPRRDMFGRGADTKGCPATFSAYYQRIRFTNGGDDFCSNDSDCNVGTDAGRCGTDLTSTLRDGGHPRACLCTVGSTREQCPNSGDGGVFSFCKFGNNGETQACMATVACMPPSSYVFRDAGPPFNGCGL